MCKIKLNQAEINKYNRLRNEYDCYTCYRCDFCNPLKGCKRIKSNTTKEEK